MDGVNAGGEKIHFGLPRWRLRQTFPTSVSLFLSAIISTFIVRYPRQGDPKGVEVAHGGEYRFRWPVVLVFVGGEVSVVYATGGVPAPAVAFLPEPEGRH